MKDRFRDYYQDKIDDLVAMKDRDHSPFSTWEDDFIDSIADQFEDGKKLSEKQMEMVDKLWAKI